MSSTDSNDRRKQHREGQGCKNFLICLLFLAVVGVSAYIALGPDGVDDLKNKFRDSGFIPSLKRDKGNFITRSYRFVRRHIVKIIVIGVVAVGACIYGFAHFFSQQYQALYFGAKEWKNELAAPVLLQMDAAIKKLGNMVPENIVTWYKNARSSVVGAKDAVQLNERVAAFLEEVELMKGAFDDSALGQQYIAFKQHLRDTLHPTGSNIAIGQDREE